MNRELADVQVGFRKRRGTRDQIANILWIIKKAREFHKKHLVLLYLLCHSLWLCESQQMIENFWKKWEYQTTLPTSWEICMQIKKRQLETDMQQQIGSKLGKVYFKAVYCHPAFLTYMHHVKCPTGWSTSWNQDCWEKYHNLRYADDTTHTAESKEELKSLLLKVKKKSEKNWLKTQHSKN